MAASRASNHLIDPNAFQTPFLTLLPRNVKATHHSRVPDCYQKESEDTARQPGSTMPIRPIREVWNVLLINAAPSTNPSKPFLSCETYACLKSRARLLGWSTNRLKPTSYPSGTLLLRLTTMCLDCHRITGDIMREKNELNKGSTTVELQIYCSTNTNTSFHPRTCNDDATLKLHQVHHFDVHINHPVRWIISLGCVSFPPCSCGDLGIRKKRKEKL